MTIKKKPKELAVSLIIKRKASRQATTHEHLADLGDTGTDRLRLSIVVDKGKVCDLVVQYETMIDEQWLPVVRYDCAHGYFHQDVYQGDKQVEKNTIHVTDLNDALTYAEDDLTANWEQYKVKFQRSTQKKKGR